MFKNQYTKIILQAIAIAGFGFVLLNLAFIFDFLIVRIIEFFIDEKFLTSYQWFPFAQHGLFVIIIGVISWFIFRSKLETIYKAIYMTVPVTVILVTVGILLYRWPIAVYLVGGLISLGALYYFYRNKQSWLYYYSLILVAFALLMMGIFGVEI